MQEPPKLKPISEEEMYRRFAGHIRFPALYHVYMAHALWFTLIVLLVTAFLRGWPTRSMVILVMLMLGSIAYAGLAIWFSVQNRQEVIEKARQAGFELTE